VCRSQAASWEGFALEQVLLTLRPNQAYFWGVHAGAELDLVFPYQGKRYGVEIKFSEAPAVTASMRSSVSELSLDHLWIVYPGNEAYPVEKNITTLPLGQLESIRAQL
jgi:predicted AAA+ superfamily ATPase